MHLDVSAFRFRDLEYCPTRIARPYKHGEYKRVLAADAARLAAVQARLVATKAAGLLVVVQGMDASGKDGTIARVFGGLSPLGLRAVAFPRPEPVDLRHDFLWRAARNLPGRGEIAVFNRSYYEDVLIIRVHPERVAEEFIDPKAVDEAFWRGRYRSILDFEAHLARSGTRLIKLFLHVSEEAQRRRFIKRLETPAKRWKLQPADVAERAFWDGYRAAYQACLAATDTDEAPWYVVPADDKKTARVVAARILAEWAEGLDLPPPDATPAREAELAEMRKALEA